MTQSPTYLPTALNYNYANASRLMRSSKVKMEIRVYVEDEGDIMFWRQFLSPHNNLYDFNISVMHCVDRDISGKDCIMKAVKNGNLILHSYMLACLDADYDLIIDNYHKYTGILRTNPYVITTRWYAIENLKADPLHCTDYYNYCTLSEKCSIDFASIVNDISSNYYELLKRLILCQSKDVLKPYYTIDAFGDDLKECTYDEKLRVSKETRAYIVTRLSALDTILSTYLYELPNIERDLASQGFTRDNCYRMFQGHYWMDRIIIPLLAGLVDDEYKKMILKKLQGVPSDEAHKEDRKQITNHYDNNVGIKDDNIGCKKARLERLINDQIHNDDLDIAQMIHKDIEIAIKRDQIVSILKGLENKK